jgi:hypothetical protein
VSDEKNEEPDARKIGNNVRREQRLKHSIFPIELDLVGSVSDHHLHMNTLLQADLRSKWPDCPNFLVYQKVHYALLDRLIIPCALAEVSDTSLQTTLRSS